MTHRSRRNSADLLFRHSRLATLGLLVAIAGGCGSGGGSGGGNNGSGLILGQDTDGDGLTDAQELAGWTVTVDRTGYGAAQAWIYHETSDPLVPDTDGDGLGDKEEFDFHCDPRMEDTDEDGLLDPDEVVRYQTNPLSVDTDGDALESSNGRALVPDPELFDGNEVNSTGTSPTLADTDGDGRSDLDEVDAPLFSPLIAEVPEAELEMAGQLDIHLNVEYAELVGSELRYGLSTTVNESHSSSSETETHDTDTYGWEVQVGYEAGFGGGFSGSASGSGSHTRGTVGRVGDEDSTSLTEESSRDETNSREMTETSASGEMSVGIRVRNTGLSTFTLTDLAVTVLDMQPPQGNPNGTSFEPPRFRTIATLVPPSAASSFTLSPSELSPVIQMAAADLNVDAIRSFMRNPNSLAFEDALFDLRNVEGVSFRFITENTYARTARIEISTGEGSVETYRVATNVDRDQNGNLIGVTMGRALTDILGFQFAVRPPVAGETHNVLSNLRGLTETGAPPYSGPYSRWLMVADDPAQLAVDFENIVLRPGHTVRLAFVADNDGDGLVSTVEDFLGSSNLTNGTLDSDGDLLTDRQEVLDGWQITVNSQSRWVFSNPRVRDSDGDGLDDLAERNAGTDPLLRDTDGDSIVDSQDPNPTIYAGIMYVNVNAAPGGNGASWATAYQNLEGAYGFVYQRNGNATPADDIAQVWVARGNYPAGSMTGFAPPPGTSTYGGFRGFERTLGARNPDPASNETNMIPDTQPGSFTLDFSSTNQTTIVDGFAITRRTPSQPAQGAQINGGSPRLHNLLFHSLGHTPGLGDVWVGAGCYVISGNPTFENCSFVGNSVRKDQPFGGEVQRAAGGGAIWIGSSSRTTITDCVFDNNRAVGHMTTTVNAWGQGGAIQAGSGVTLTMTRCVLSGNLAEGRNQAGAVWDSGGGALSAQGTVLLDSCDFYFNHGPHIDAHGNVAAVNCRFYQSRTPDPAFFSADAIRVFGSFAATNCTFLLTRSGFAAAGTQGAFRVWTNTALFTTNCIFEDVSFLSDTGATNRTGLSSHGIVYNCSGTPGQITSLIPSPSGVAWADRANGDLRLLATSPAIDVGINAVDVAPYTPGLQPIPFKDLDGNPRFFNGLRSRPTPIIDLGAYEYQGGGQ